MKFARLIWSATPSLALAALLAPTSAWACASCGCTLSSDWQNPTEPGFRLDVRYDYVSQSQLRSGTNTISPQAASTLSNSGNQQEVEKYTVNNYYTVALGYTFSSEWRADVQLPFVARRHSTLGTASDGVTAGAGGGQYDSDFSALGDVKVIGSYQGFSPQHNFGIQLGLKLPTGKFNLTGTSTDAATPGPVAVDRALQPGSGTTDLIFGFYFVDALNKNWDYYTNDFYQSALNSRDAYRPGDGLNLNVGLRYMGLSHVMPELQANARYVQIDSGANADTISTGGSLVYLSPGAVVPVSDLAAVYAFLQVPIFQNFQGVQLAPTYTASVGARYKF